MSDLPDPDALRDALSAFPGLDDEGVEEIAQEIETTGVVRVFGYGSLPWKPHTELSDLVKADLTGYKRGFVCQDTYYRGSKENPGITLGLDTAEAEDGGEPPTTSGAVLVTPASRAVEDLGKLAKREVPPDMPIYTFKLLEVEQDNGETVKALTCVADTESDLYVGNKLSMEEKAGVIARCSGKTGTNRDYLANTVRTAEEQGTPDPDLAKLLAATDRARLFMAPAERRAIEALDVPKDAGDAPVKTLSTTAAPAPAAPKAGQKIQLGVSA